MTARAFLHLLGVLFLLLPVVAAQFPIVDLGYELHQASFNETTGLYTFFDVRYAAPPTGNVRWRTPSAPAVDRSVVRVGSGGRMCPQGDPIWADISVLFASSVLNGTPFNDSTDISSYPYSPPSSDPSVSEDCLFLDVVVPKAIFDRAQDTGSDPQPEPAPVLVWIHGGGYIAGHKAEWSNSTGLIERSMKEGKDGVVFVAINYRLGAFGWLAGSTLTDSDGIENAGLYDQRFALEWVSQNIHLFGGDPARVSIMGISAGGGSIIHQITAYGGTKGPVPFHQAILQSPGWFPSMDKSQQEDIQKEFLSLLNVSTIAEARALPSNTLIAANAYQLAEYPIFGTAPYGPVVDGIFVPKLAKQLLRDGSFDRDINIMVGHTTDEGILFTPPYSQQPDGLEIYIQNVLPDASPRAANYITNTLYPPIYDGTYGYNTSVSRVSSVIADIMIQCDTDYLSRAYNFNTYSYLFSVYPAVHSWDLPYTFYTPGDEVDFEVNFPLIANTMQDYFISFVETGTPTSPQGPPFEMYGVNRQILNFGPTNITQMRDPTRLEQCAWWQNAPWYSYTK